MASAGEGEGAKEEEAPFFLVFMMDDLFLPGPDANASQEMKSQVWGRLPDELLEKVLLVLPAASQARCQAVCRTWRKFLTSKVFKEESADLAFTSGRHICGFVHRDSALFLWDGPKDDPEGQERVEELEVSYKVHKLSLAFLPRSFWNSIPGDFFRIHLVFRDGLILMGKSECTSRGKELKLCVVNPINQTWRELPVLITDFWADPRVSLRVHDNDGFARFNVFVHYSATPRTRLPVYSGLHCSVMEVYCSITNAWCRSETTKDASEGHLLLSVVTGPCGSFAVGKELVYAAPDPLSEYTSTLSLFTSNTGEYVTKLPGPRKKNFVVVLFEHARIGDMVLGFPEVRNKCEVWELIQRGSQWEKWEKLSSLPKELMAQVSPREPCEDETSSSDDDLEEGEDGESFVDVESDAEAWELCQFDPSRHVVVVSDAELAGDVVFLTLEGSPNECQLVAYHVLQRSWKIVFCDPYPWVPDDTSDLARSIRWQRLLHKVKHGAICNNFLQPRLGLRV